MAEKDKRYYWLKLKRDFFKRHDIQIIEDMPNGKDYILFYLKLLCESVDHDGNLRFSDEIPYNEQMLATITRTNIDIVRSAIKIFEQLKMLEIYDDGTYYMHEVEKLLGTESYWAVQKRNKRLEIGQCPTCPSKSIEKEKDIEIEKDKDLAANYKEQRNDIKRVRERLERYANKDLIQQIYGSTDLIDEVIEALVSSAENGNTNIEAKAFERDIQQRLALVVGRVSGKLDIVDRAKYITTVFINANTEEDL